MTQTVTLLVAALLTLVLVPVSEALQTKDYDWYPGFRSWMQTSVPREQRSPAAVAEAYRRKLETEGVAAAEIERRLTLLRTKRQELENDFWNRFFAVDAPTFNTEPNAYLVSVVEGRAPGRALDVGMGEGRNALYLAKLGWDVTGFDPADQAVALAQKRAAALKVKIDTAIALDTAFHFGRGQWDLILYSWSHPAESATKAIDALRPGGIVVVEAGSAWFPENGLVRMFDGLRIVHYENRVGQSDFFNRSDMPIVRLLAEKPRK